MGAGGGMWAVARAELRRPGLRGGGGVSIGGDTEGAAGCGAGFMGLALVDVADLAAATAAGLAAGTALDGGGAALVTLLGAALAAEEGLVLTAGLATSLAGALA